MQTNYRKPRILVADDEEDVLVLMQSILAREGFEVEVSPNGENIMELVSHDPPDIILLDIRMQGVDGEEICKQLKGSNSTSKIPIVLFSANADIETIAASCGADDYLLKPFNAQDARSIFNHFISHPGS
jgi:CheY-like chemotaxis protein